MTVQEQTEEARQPPAPRRALSYQRASRKWLPDFLARRIFGAPLAPSPDEWTHVLAALRQGDPLMDALVTWMLAENAAERRALFERALTRGIVSIEDPPEALRAFFKQIEAAPPWLDRSTLQRGARAAQLVGMAGFYVLRDLALMGGYVHFNSMNQTLVATGALQKNVALRLAETGKWLADATAPEGLERFASGFLTTVRVRMVHALVRRAVSRKSDWEEDTWGLPINQLDMMATYLAFGPVTLLGARAFGVPLKQSEARAAMHMWRYIGWLLGVDERWLAITEGDGLRKLYHASLTHRLPDEKVRELGSALRDEPLTRRIPALDGHPWLKKLVRRYLYAKHVANSSLVAGPWQRRRLGLPLLSLPWYLALSAPLRLLLLSWYRWRGGRALEGHFRRSAEKQQRLLSSYFANGQPSIMGSATAPPPPVR